MLNKSVARRYAEAFFKIAQEANRVDEFQQELQLITESIQKVEELQEYIDHLLIPGKQKKETVSKIFASQVSEVTLKFFMLLIDKKRESYIFTITDEFVAMADEARNITKADLISAQEVSEEDVKTLAERLSASTGRTVKLKQTVDQSLIGGIMLRIGDRIIDATVAKRLNMLKEQLKKAKIS